MTEEELAVQSAALAKLREPFPKNQISVLPKPYSKDSPKSFCSICKSKHGMPAAHLDYVGHADLTARLLDVDPLWTWEALALDEAGLPVFDRNGGLWIKLTIAGVTRLGYGDSGGKTGGNAIKEAIGDALRNAGMRFGAALDLWSKSEKADDSGQADAPQAPAKKTVPKKTTATPPPAEQTQDLSASLLRLDEDEKAFLKNLWKAAGYGFKVTAVPSNKVTEVTTLIDSTIGAAYASDGQ